MSSPQALIHSGHDYDQLLGRWQLLAERTDWELTELSRESGYPVICVERRSDSSGGEPVYLSAGVHGDECAPVWALLFWAEQEADGPGERPLLMFPCLNPYGLIHNERVNGEGIDLNRSFQDRSLPLIEAWQSKVKDRRFSRCLHLHEDYDALGSYAYHLAKGGGLGERILEAAERVIPRDPRNEIDGQPFCAGLLRHDGDIGDVVEKDLGGGFPEAIHLYLHHSRETITFETPSEMALERRIEAHRRVIEAFAGGGGILPQKG